MSRRSKGAKDYIVEQEVKIKSRDLDMRFEIGFKVGFGIRIEKLLDLSSLKDGVRKQVIDNKNRRSHNMLNSFLVYQ